MRLVKLAVPLTLSATLMSGCSWLGGLGFGGQNQSYGASQSQYGPSAPYGSYSDPCQIPYAQAPVPEGCHPSEVSIGTSHPGGFPQEPQFGTQYASGGYGSHAGGNAYAPGHHAAAKPELRKPRFRAALDLGLEKNVSGTLYDPTLTGLSVLNDYDPTVYAEGTVEGTPGDGEVVTVGFTADDRLREGIPGPTDTRPWDEASEPSLSIGDAWSAPASIGASGEFILNDRATLYGRAGYTRAEGNHGEIAVVEATIFEETVRETFESGASTGVAASARFIPEQDIASFTYDFSDLERIDLEAGGRLYLNPVAGQRSGRTVTPFLGASAGASHYNAVSYTVDQNRQLSYESVFDDEAEYYDVDRPTFDLDGDPTTPATNRVDLYDSQWVPSGRLSAGLEWQVTPKTALAFETGVRIEGARDYANGAKGDTNISVPVTLRGSFNF